MSHLVHSLFLSNGLQGGEEEWRKKAVLIKQNEDN